MPMNIDMKQLRSRLGAAVLSACLFAPVALNAQPQWLESNRVSLRYDLSGQGQRTVVLLHEIGMSLEGWDEIMPSLTKRHRVLRYDQRGFGQSEKIRGSISMDDEVEDLRDLLDGLQIKQPVTLVGGAIGATIAVKFAAKYPDRVGGLVLVSPIFNVTTSNSAPPPAGPPATANMPRNMDTATLIETQGVRAYLDQQLENLYPTSLRANHPERVARFTGIQLASDPTSRAMVVRLASRSGNVSQELAQIKVPTLVVATSMFALRPAATVKAIADAMQNASFVELPTGHLAALESPELVAPMLNRFFDEHKL